MSCNFLSWEPIQFWELIFSFFCLFYFSLFFFVVEFKSIFTLCTAASGQRYGGDLFCYGHTSQLWRFSWGWGELLDESLVLQSKEATWKPQLGIGQISYICIHIIYQQWLKVGSGCLFRDGIPLRSLDFVDRRIFAWSMKYFAQVQPDDFKWTIWWNLCARGTHFLGACNLTTGGLVEEVQEARNAGYGMILCVLSCKVNKEEFMLRGKKCCVSQRQQRWKSCENPPVFWLRLGCKFPSWNPHLRGKLLEGEPCRFGEFGKGW